MNMEEILSQIIHDLQFINVESGLVLGSLVVLIVGLLNPSKWLTKLFFVLTIFLGFYFNSQAGQSGFVLSNSLFLSPIAYNFSSLFLINALLILLFHRSEKHGTEFYFLILSVLIGSVFFMKANSIIVLYLAIELTSFGSYLLTNFSFKKEGHEAGIKYLLFGAVSSAIMLLGLAILYGVTGSLYVSTWEVDHFDDLLPIAGLGLTLCGLFFKASVFPFHIWVPATYQSGPNDAIAFVSIVPKLAGLVLMKRLLQPFALDHGVITFSLVLGLLTLIFGTFAALNQANVRRMISFGAIAHSGFLLPFAIINTPTADASFWWYAGAYLFMNTGIFYLISFFENHEIYHLRNYASLGNRIVLVSFAMTLVVISLVGLPPVAGFTAKFFLFGTLWEHYLSSGHTIYAIYLAISIIITVVSLFFYLKIPYHLYLVRATTNQSIDTSFSTKFVATLFSIVLLLLFFAPQILVVMQELLNNTPHE